MESPTNIGELPLSSIRTNRYWTARWIIFSLISSKSTWRRNSYHATRFKSENHPISIFCTGNLLTVWKIECCSFSHADAVGPIRCWAWQSIQAGIRIVWVIGVLPWESSLSSRERCSQQGSHDHQPETQIHTWWVNSRPSYHLNVGLILAALPPGETNIEIYIRWGEKRILDQTW